jgi:hypothetical protein
MFFEEDKPVVPFLHLFSSCFLYVITYCCYFKVLHVFFVFMFFNLLSLFACTDMYISYYFSSLKNKSFTVKIIEWLIMANHLVVHLLIMCKHL